MITACLDGGDIDYILAMVETQVNLLSVAGTMMQMILQAISMDQRVSKHGVNACVAHPLIPLCTDSHTLYQTIIRLLTRSWTMYDDISDRQLDVLEG
jgi:hypothetical protein